MILSGSLPVLPWISEFSYQRPFSLWGLGWSSELRLLCLLQGSGCFGLFSSSLAVVVPSATEELNSGCNSNSGSVKSTCWLTMGHATGLALFQLVHCLTFVSDLRLLGAEPVAPPKPGPSTTPHFTGRTLLPGKGEITLVAQVLPSSMLFSLLQASSAPSNPQPMRMWFTTQAHHHLLTLWPLVTL